MRVLTGVEMLIWTKLGFEKHSDDGCTTEPGQGEKIEGEGGHQQAYGEVSRERGLYQSHVR
jgi:hypothetical protein